MLVSAVELRSLPDVDVAALLRERSGSLLADTKAPEAPRDLAILFQLDHQVRNGGFAQYFFNESCLNAFDAWFASEAISPEAHALLGLALVRLGAEFHIDLDLRAIIARDSKGVGPAYGTLLQVSQAAHTSPVTLLEDFARFRDRLAEPKQGHRGLVELQMQFFDETDIPASIVGHVRAKPEAFTR